MGRRKGMAPPQKYGSPLFCAAWVPGVGDGGPGAGGCVIVGGGGGAGSHGVKNVALGVAWGGRARPDGGGGALEMAACATADMGASAPQGMAVHPDGRAALVASDGGVRVLTVEPSSTTSGGRTVPTVLLASRANDDERLGSALGGGGCSAVAFSADGASFAVGRDDGSVRAFSWPELRECEVAAGSGHSDAVNALAFSPDGTALASTASDGTCLVRRVGGGANAKYVDVRKELHGGKGEGGNGRARACLRACAGAHLRAKTDARERSRVGSFRGAAYADGALYTGVNVGGEGFITKWVYNPADATQLRIASRRRVFRDALTSLAAGGGSPAAIAAGSSEGDVCVARGAGGGISLKATHRGAHGIFVTALAVHPTTGAVSSVSADAGVRVFPSSRAPGGGGGALARAFFLIVLMLATLLVALLIGQAHLYFSTPRCS